MPDIKLKNFKKLELNNARTAELKLHVIDGAPTLVLLLAGESNKPYFNAQLRKARKGLRAARSGMITAAMLEESRDEDRELYAAHVVRDWRGLVDDDGKSVPFSEDACKQFLHALPNWLFDEVREFATSISNFMPEAMDADKTAKK